VRKASLTVLRGSSWNWCSTSMWNRWGWGDPAHHNSPLRPHDPQHTFEHVSLVTVSVFDTLQLADIDTQPLPEYFITLADNRRELYRRLALTVAADGITLHASKETRGVHKMLV